MFNASKFAGNNLFSSGVWLRFFDCGIIEADKRPVGVRKTGEKR